MTTPAKPTSAKPKTVLAAVDIGPSTEIVLAAAAREAAGGKLIACHVLPDFGAVRPLFPHIALEDTTHRIGLEAAVRARLTELAALHQGEAVLTVGEPYSTIVKLAQDRGADVVVTGAPSSPDGWVAGTAERVLRYAPCPVLLVRGTAEGPVVAATDLSHPSLPALRAGAERAEARGVPLVAMHVVDVIRWLDAISAIAAAVASSIPAPNREPQLVAAAESALAAALGEIPATGQVEVGVGSPAKVLVERVKALGASLLVVATHGRTGFDRVLVGSVAEAVARTAPCSVLVVRHGRSTGPHAPGGDAP